MTFLDAEDRPSERPEDARAALERDYPRVGYERGEPLLAESYDDYPDEVLLPQTREIVAKAADTLATVEDIGDELGVSTSTVEKALNLHGLDAPNGNASFDTPNAEEIDLPLGPTLDTEDVRSAPHKDARVLEHCFVVCHFDAADISSFLEAELNGGRDPSKGRIRVPKSEVRSELADIGLVEEEATDPEFEDGGRGRLPSGTIGVSDESSPGSTNPGTDIDLGSVEESSNVTVR